jgi:hypothetical protein
VQKIYFSTVLVHLTREVSSTNRSVNWPCLKVLLCYLSPVEMFGHFLFNTTGGHNQSEIDEKVNNLV